MAPCLAFALPLHAADDDQALALPSTAITETLSQPEQPDLSTPTTSGSRLNLSALQTPASVTSIGAEQIQSRNNLTVQDAVTRSPGITYIGSPGNDGTALSARGFTGHSSTMQLFDGTRLYVGAGTVTFPVDTWSVERIDILRGPASVLYGEGATGAVVNVVPKKPFDGEIRNRVRLGYAATTAARQRWTAAVRWPIASATASPSISRPAMAGSTVASRRASRSAPPCAGTLPRT